MNNIEDQEMDRQLRELLEPLRSVPQRRSELANAGRNRYLEQVNLLAAGIPPLPVSASPFRSLNGWKRSVSNPFKRKERYSMLSVMAVLAVVFTMAFGGAGATVFAAQQSLPDTVLYPVKLMSETVWTGLLDDPEEQINLQLRFADRRVQEIAALLSHGEPVPEQVVARYQTALEAVFQKAAGMHDAGMVLNLEKLQRHLRDQDRIMAMTQVGTGSVETAALERVRTIIREQIRRVETGIEDPLQLRQQYQLRLNQGVVTGTITTTVTATITATLPVSGTPGVQYGPGPQVGPGPDAGPGTSAGPGPDAGPGPETGPGPQTSPNPDPGPKATQPPGPASNLDPQPSQNANPDSGSGSSTTDPGSAPDPSGGSGAGSGNHSPAQPSAPSSGSGGSGKP